MDYGNRDIYIEEWLFNILMDLIPETDKIDMAYLKSERIGKVITKGLAELYRVKPQFPIEFFAKWLLNYNNTEANRGSMQEHLQYKEELMYKLFWNQQPTGRGS